MTAIAVEGETLKELDTTIMTVDEVNDLFDELAECDVFNQWVDEGMNEEGIDDVVGDLYTAGYFRHSSKDPVVSKREQIGRRRGLPEQHLVRQTLVTIAALNARGLLGPLRS